MWAKEKKKPSHTRTKPKEGKMSILKSIEFLLKEGRQGADKETIKLCQKKLFDNGCANIPLSYAHFLEKVNGANVMGLSLFGITDEKTDDVCDIYNRNNIAGTKKQKDVLFLGDNFNEYLCYSWKQKSYLIQNKIYQQMVKRFELFEPALLFFMRDYIQES